MGLKKDERSCILHEKINTCTHWYMRIKTNGIQNASPQLTEKWSVTFLPAFLYCHKESLPENMSDPICIQSGSAQSRKRWPEAGHVVLAHQLASRPGPFGQNLTRSARIKSDLGHQIGSRSVCTTWSRPSLEKWNWIRCRKSDLTYTIRPDSGCTLAVMAITDHNQKASGSDPACLLGSLPKTFFFFFFFYI